MCGRLCWILVLKMASEGSEELCWQIDPLNEPYFWSVSHNIVGRLEHGRMDELWWLCAVNFKGLVWIIRKKGNKIIHFPVSFYANPLFYSWKLMYLHNVKILKSTVSHICFGIYFAQFGMFLAYGVTYKIIKSKHATQTVITKIIPFISSVQFYQIYLKKNNSLRSALMRIEILQWRFQCYQIILILCHSTFIHNSTYSMEIIDFLRI